MARLQRRRFSEPDEIRPVPKGTIEVVWLDDRVVGRQTYQPGWRWSVDVKPTAGSSSCQFHHFGVTLSGLLRVQMQDGIELEIGPGDVFEIPPGHDAWVIGDEAWVSVDFEAMRGYGRADPSTGRRTLATIVMTDIVDSTGRAVTLGPARWRELVSRHNEAVERVIDRHGGRLVKTTGDGVIALFDSAEQAIRAAAALRPALEGLGLPIRVGVHTGDVDLTASDVRGVAVHTAARIMGLGGPHNVLASRIVFDLVEADDLEFEDFGVHELKGLPGQRQIYRLVWQSSRRRPPAAAE
jgi:class 3 adenylate cyclase